MHRLPRWTCPHWQESTQGGGLEKQSQSEPPASESNKSPPNSCPVMADVHSGASALQGCPCPFLMEEGSLRRSICGPALLRGTEGHSWVARVGGDKELIHTPGRDCAGHACRRLPAALDLGGLLSSESVVLWLHLLQVPLRVSLAWPTPEGSDSRAGSCGRAPLLLGPAPAPAHATSTTGQASSGCPMSAFLLLLPSFATAMPESDISRVTR